MTLTAGTRLGAYEVTALIGAGGMGEVYRARDTKLNRDVALKILPELFVVDPDRLARFKREAQLLASLNHPNIAGIHGFEDTGAVHALVLELIEGPTLADRIAHGPIPLDEALPIARQLAEALEAAHEQGIIHRDLKPANIKVRPDGMVKVLDFGLAKAFEAEPVGTAAGMSMSPTITSPAATRVGTILGTAAYMSPEQARGKAVDKRSDIWAFGCVLYEMLTGRRAFGGDEVTDTLAFVITKEPDWSALPASVPSALHRLLRRCLEKDRKRRLTDIGVARLEIDEALATSVDAEVAAAALPRTATRERVVWAGAVLAAAALSAMVVHYAGSTSVDTPEVRLQIDAPVGNNVVQGGFAISPDGQQVVFRANSERSIPQLWLRSLASEAGQPLMGTEGGGAPFWSPDGRSIAFTANGQLKRLELVDGRIQTLASPALGNGTWSADGMILFTRTFAGPLFRVAATGGEVAAVTHVDPPMHSGHIRPQFLPDGRHFLFYAFGSSEGKGVYVGSLDSMEVHPLLRSDAAAVFAPPDLVLFAQEGALVAQRLNLGTLELTGNPMTVARQIAVDVVNGYAAVAASPAGPIAYRSQSPERQLTWLNRSGQQIGTLGDAVSAVDSAARFSPDGRTIALSRTGDGNQDVWLMDAARATWRRFTADPGVDTAPVWSPDGNRVVVGSDRRAGNLDLYEKPSNGTEAETLLLETPEDKTAEAWSPDGRFILYSSNDPKTRRDLWALPLFGDRKPLPIARTTAAEIQGRLSPDGRWVAYVSDESGRNEAYVQPFPGPGAKVQISIAGGSNPEWRGDGREIFYSSQEGPQLMAVLLSPNGGRLDPRTPVVLFPIPPGPYVAAPDGQRFLVAATSEQASAITILLNWAGVRR
jgi:Tol biopolymer transport system component